MILTKKALWLSAAVLTASPAAPGVTPPARMTEYSVIIDRNPFGLVDPPPPTPAVEPPVKKVEADPPPNVDLTGFFRNARRGKTVALFLVENKEGGTAKKQSYMWAEGEGDNGMKVLAINEAEETVRLSVRGVESTITFSKPKPAAAPAGLQIPGRPNTRTPVIPTAGNPTFNPAPNTAPQQFESSGRTRFGRTTTSSSAVGGAVPTQVPGDSANLLQGIPPRNMRAVGNSGQTRMEALTPREQAVLIEVNREVLKQSGQLNIMPPLPPTSLTTPEDRARITVPATLPGQ